MSLKYVPAPITTPPKKVKKIHKWSGETASRVPPMYKPRLERQIGRFGKWWCESGSPSDFIYKGGEWWRENKNKDGSRDGGWGWFRRLGSAKNNTKAGAIWFQRGGMAGNRLLWRWGGKVLSQKGKKRRDLRREQLSCPPPPSSGAAHVWSVLVRRGFPVCIWIRRRFCSAHVWRISRGCSKLLCYSVEHPSPLCQIFPRQTHILQRMELLRVRGCREWWSFLRNGETLTRPEKVQYKHDELSLAFVILAKHRTQSCNPEILTQEYNFF